MPPPQRNTTIRDRHRQAIAQGKPACWICGEPIDYTLRYPDPWCYTVDHVIPLDAGGPDTLANKRAAHWTHNRAKGVRAHAPVIRRSGALNRP